MNNKISPLYSWPVIIIAFVIFWPVGLFLLIKRFSVDKKSALTVSRSVLNTLGIFLIIFGGIGFAGCISDPEASGGVVVALFFVAGGIIMVLKAKKQKQLANNVKQYISIIINNNVTQLDSIALTVNKSFDAVKKEIIEMINKGYLKNAYINEATREVVLANSAPTVNTYNQTVQHNTYSPAVETRVIACPCCGANNTITGAVGECEYCGSALK